MPSQRYRLGASLKGSVGFSVFLAAIEVADFLRLYPLDTLGILPREWIGLRGILFAPLLHGGFAHLAANVVPLVVLCALLWADSKNRPGMALAWIWFLSGLGTWLIGRGGSIHLGASSLIFGMASYLMVAGIVSGSWRSFLVAISVLVGFGGIFYGVLPQEGRISWEGHLCGAISGALMAWRILR